MSDQHSTSLDVRPTDITIPARYGFGPEQTEAIKRTVAKDCTPAEFVMFMELAARYHLDPFAKHIWAAKMGDNKPVAILVGRDGYLAIAERHPAYQGMDSDVVRDGDTFKLQRTPHPEVVHEYGEQRGAILGAWAMVYRTDRIVPTYFYAPIGDYKPTGAKLQYSPWGKQESIMMLKCAQSTALRLAFNVSGFVPAEDVGSAPGQPPLVNGAEPESPDDLSSVYWGPPDVEEKLKALFARANEVRTDAFRPPKIRLMLAGRNDHRLMMLVREIEEWIRRHGAEPWPEGEPEAEDADVVDEAAE